jgi:predicted amidohydrolase
VLSPDPADLFCQLFDELSDPAMEHDRAWRRKVHLRELSTEVRHDALELGIRPEYLLRRIRRAAGKAGEMDAARWAAARGLDEALATCHPLLGAPAGSPQSSPLERRIRRRYTRSGRFDTGAVRGALLPKLVESGRLPQATANRAQAFGAVHRVPPEIFESPHVDFRRVRSEDQPTARTRGGHAGIVVACAPMLESLEELDLRPVCEQGANFFEGAPRATDAFGDRIRAVLRQMDESGATLGICPELSLSEDVLNAWRRAVTESEERRESQLEWIFVGSGPFASDGERPPYNRAVLLDRKTGRTVHTQDKLFAFTLMPDQIKDWGLGHLFATPVDERMTRGEKLSIRETAWGRIAVLICEDLAKLLEPQVGPLITGFGVSLLITPVFSKEVKAFFWEHQSARVYANQMGTVTIVANSLVIPRAKGDVDEVGTCLVNTPGSWKVGKSSRSDEISLFWVTTKSVEVPATQPVTTDPA